MSKNDSGVCCAGEDFVTRMLGKVGITRSMLWTLTLVPFAWEGVVWVGHECVCLGDKNFTHEG